MNVKVSESAEFFFQQFRQITYSKETYHYCISILRGLARAGLKKQKTQFI